MKPKVLITRRVPQQGIDQVAAHCEVELWDSDLPIPRDVLLEKVADKDGIYCLSDRAHQRRVAGCRSQAQGGQPDGRGLRQHRRGRLHSTRHPRRQHAGRFDGNYRRFHLGAADGRGTPSGRGRRICTDRPVGDLGPDVADGPRPVRRHARHRGHGAHRPGRRPPRHGLRHAHSLHRRAAHRQRGAGIRRNVCQHGRSCWPSSTS